MDFIGEIDETPPALSRMMTGTSFTFFSSFRIVTTLSGSG